VFGRLYAPRRRQRLLTRVGEVDWKNYLNEWQMTVSLASGRTWLQTSTWTERAWGGVTGGRDVPGDETVDWRSLS